MSQTCSGGILEFLSVRNYCQTYLPVGTFIIKNSLLLTRSCRPTNDNKTKKIVQLYYYCIYN